MRASTHDDHHIVLGVSNVDEHVRGTYVDALSAGQDLAGTDGQDQAPTLGGEDTYARIARALAQDYFSIYYVDLETDHFVEYSSNDQYRGLEIERAGEDFFNLSRANIVRVVHPEDVPVFLDVFTKENVLAELERTGSFTLTYRLMLDGQPFYVHLKANRMADPADPHMVVGVSNIDAQMRREQEHAVALRQAQEAAYRDALTGVRSKLAYTEDELELSQRMAAHEAEAFAVVICDVNDLKAVNDTLGHAAGDELIRTGCHTVCVTFAHSPVYRYGGDEFVAILRGADYERRRELMARMAECNQEALASGGVVVACGMAEYRPGVDEALASVFERADAAMYENKKALKKERAQA